MIKSRATISVAVVCIGLTSGCGSTQGSDAQQQKQEVTHHASVDGPTYASVTELAAQSELVVSGVVGDVISREQDSGGAASEIAEQASVPVKFVGLRVAQSSNEVLVPVGSTVPVVWLDFGADVETDVTDLVSGSEVVLFARTMTPKTAPGIDTVDLFLVPSGGQNGVFDVRDGLATTRDATLVSLNSDNSKVGDEPLTAPVDDITRVAEQAIRN